MLLGQEQRDQRSRLTAPYCSAAQVAGARPVLPPVAATCKPSTKQERTLAHTSTLRSNRPPVSCAAGWVSVQ